MQQQIKSRQRVTEHGEVFTAEREVKAMCDLVKQETERIDSRFLEIKTRGVVRGVGLLTGAIFVYRRYENANNIKKRAGGLPAVV